ncbi:MAG: DHHA1 domain-containing protein [bacterium]
MTQALTRRIVTNSDLDAIVSAVLLKRIEPVGAVKYLPKEELRNNRFQGTLEDIVVNMPFVKGCRLWFDHHDSNDVPSSFEGRYDPDAPSAARVIWDYYAERDNENAFQGLEHLLKETDRVDSADFTPEDIKQPGGVVLVSFLIDSHPLEKVTASENDLMISLLDSGDPNDVLNHPVFEPRARKFLDELEESKQAQKKALHEQDGLVTIDFRSLGDREKELCNNKFLPFVIYPDSHTLLRIKRLNDKKVKLNLGYNMFKSGTPPVHYGNLLKQFEGGGHQKAAGCAVPNNQVEKAVETIREAVLK